MNRILETEGYRFCQADYDYDGSSILTVNHDPWGERLVYSGFLLFAASGLWVLISRRCRWRYMIRSLSHSAPSSGNTFRRATDCILMIAAVISITFFITLWRRSGHIPLTNTYETLLFAVLILELLILLICRRDIMLRFIGMLFTGALALAAYLTGKSFTEAPLIPVLNSPGYRSTYHL